MKITTYFPSNLTFRLSIVKIDVDFPVNRGNQPPLTTKPTNDGSTQSFRGAGSVEVAGAPGIPGIPGCREFRGYRDTGVPGLPGCRGAGVPVCRGAGSSGGTGVPRCQGYRCYRCYRSYQSFQSFRATEMAVVPNHQKYRGHLTPLLLLILRLPLLLHHVTIDIDDIFAAHNIVSKEISQLVLRFPPNLVINAFRYGR